MIQQKNEWIGSAVKQVERLNDHQRDRQRFLNGEPLWGLFTGSNVQERDDPHANDGGDCLANAGGMDTQPGHRRPQQSPEDWLPDPAQSDAGQGNPNWQALNEASRLLRMCLAMIARRCPWRLAAAIESSGS